MGCKPGLPVHLSAHSTNASSGVELDIYTSGSTTSRTLAANEILEIDSFIMSVDDGTGDITLFFGANMTPADGARVFRGTLAANSVVSHTPVDRAGPKGQTLRLLSPAGTIDVQATGRIRKV